MAARAAVFGFLLLPILLAVPAVEAHELRAVDATLAIGSARLKMDAVAFGDEAREVRRAMDRDGDGMVVREEVLKYADERQIRDDVDRPGCLTNLKVIRMGDQTPRRLSFVNFSFMDAEGPSNSSYPVVASVELLMLYERHESSSTVTVSFSSTTLQFNLHVCDLPGDHSLYVYGKRAPADSKPKMRILFEGGVRPDVDSVQPGSVAKTWNKKVFSAETSSQRDLYWANDISVAVGPGSADSAAASSPNHSGSPGLGTWPWLTVAVVAFSALWAPLRWRILKLFGVALFSRIEKDELLDHKSREHLMQLILHNPGLSVTDLQRLTGLGRGTVAYHLHALESKRMVGAYRDGFRARFFAGAVPASPEPYLTNRQARIIAFLKANPGRSRAEIARELGITPAVLAYHLRRLHALDRL